MFDRVLTVLSFGRTIRGAGSHLISSSTSWIRGPCCGFTWELSWFSKIPKYDKPLSAQDLWAEDQFIHTLQTLFKDIEVSYITSFTATGISMLQRYSQTAVRLRLARSLRYCCSKPQHYPPLRPRGGLTLLGVRHPVENRIDRCQEYFFFWTSTCAGFLKHNCGRNPQTGVECMGYLSSVPHSCAVFDFATGCVLAEAAEDSLARHMHQRYP